jgi:hypothetical protein
VTERAGRKFILRFVRSLQELFSVLPRELKFFVCLVDLGLPGTFRNQQPPTTQQQFGSHRKVFLKYFMFILCFFFISQSLLSIANKSTAFNFFSNFDSVDIALNLSKVYFIMKEHVALMIK